MEADQTLRVELVYISPEKQMVMGLKVKRGTTIKAAILQSGLPERAPEIDLEVNKVGIFNEIRPLDDVLKDGDRIEIYRPLRLDPKQARRRRAARADPRGQK